TGIDVTGGRHGGHDESLHGALLGEELRGGGAVASSAATVRSLSYAFWENRPPVSISLAGSVQVSSCRGSEARRSTSIRRFAWRWSTSAPRFHSSTTAARSRGNSEGSTTPLSSPSARELIASPTAASTSCETAVEPPTSR